VTLYEATTTRLAREELGACALIEDLLPLYLEGEVSPGSRDTIVAHLGRCERCAGYLAGAQSIRTQLRTQERGRSEAVAAQPREQQAALWGSWLLRAFLLLAACGTGLVGSLGFWVGVNQGGAVATVLGMIMVVLSFGALAALANPRGLLGFARLAALATGCGVVGIGSSFVVVAGAPGPLPALVGVALWAVGLLMVWPAVWYAPQAAAGALLPNGQAIVGRVAPWLPVLLGGTLVVLAGLAGATFLGGVLWAPPTAAVLGLLALLLALRGKRA
jgi:predicted anti-sigma-YlaC factor YlaD